MSNYSQEIYYTVYRTVNLINNKEYIGIHKTKNLNDGYLGSGYNIMKAIKLYGKENFRKEILFIFYNSEDMINKEYELVNEEYVKREDTYNLVSGGIYREYMSEESKNKISITHRGKSISEEHKIKLREVNKGRKISEKERLERSIRMTGENNPMYGKISHFKGKPHTDKVKEKLRQYRIGKTLSEETKQKISESLSGENNPNYGKVMSEEAKENLRKKNLGKKASEETKKKLRNKIITEETRNKLKERVFCPHCNKSGNKSNMTRWHFDKCKNKTISLLSDNNESPIPDEEYYKVCTEMYLFQLD